MANKIKLKRRSVQPKRKPFAGKPGGAEGDVYQEAMAHHQAGRLSQAESFYRQILLLAPDDPEAQYRLGNVFMDQGRFDEAASCYRRAT